MIDSYQKLFTMNIQQPLWALLNSHRVVRLHAEISLLNLTNRTKGVSSKIRKEHDRVIEVKIISHDNVTVIWVIDHHRFHCISN